jgi:hypothetical protein
VIKALEVQSRRIRRSTLKKNTNSAMKKEPRAKRAKAQRPEQRETKEVLAELMEKLRGKLELKATSGSQAEAGPRGELSPNVDRLTVGVDLGDQWSHFCILGLRGETLSEGRLRTSAAEFAEFFQALPSARVVMEVGTHSPWMQEIIAGEGHIHSRCTRSGTAVERYGRTWWCCERGRRWWQHGPS